MDQKQTTVSQDKTPAAGNQEQSLYDLLARIAKQSGGSLGDLSGLANGKIGGPTGQDEELVADSIGRAGDIARRALERQYQISGGQLSESLASKGLSGSSIEGFQNSVLETDMMSQIAQAIAQAQQQGGEALMNLPFQRAGIQLSANQELFNRLTGAANPVLSSLLQNRLNNKTTTQTTKSNGGIGDVIKLGMQAGGMIFGGPAGAAGASALTGGLQQPDASGYMGHGHYSPYALN